MTQDLVSKVALRGTPPGKRKPGRPKIPRDGAERDGPNMGCSTGSSPGP